MQDVSRGTPNEAALTRGILKAGPSKGSPFLVNHIGNKLGVPRGTKGPEAEQSGIAFHFI